MNTFINRIMCTNRKEELSAFYARHLTPQRRFLIPIVIKYLLQFLALFLEAGTLIIRGLSSGYAEFTVVAQIPARNLVVAFPPPLPRTQAAAPHQVPVGVIRALEQWQMMQLRWQSEM